jgi:hypothetical protein
LCCLQGERKWCRFVNVTGRFPMSLDWVREHKERNATNGGAPMGVVFVLPSGRKKVVSFRKCYWEVSNVFGLGS